MRRTSLAPCALLVGLAACGKVQTFADAAVVVNIDADTTPDGAVAGPVKVLVLDNNQGAPAPNVPIVFMNADGSVVLDTKTSGTGTAMADMLAGGSVTAILPDGTDRFQILTTLDVAPGDNLVLGSEPRDNTDAGSFTVNNIPAPFGGYSTTVYGPCGSTSIAPTDTSAVLNLSNYCKDSTTDLLIVQRSGSDTYSILKPNVQFRGGNTETLSNPQWTNDGQFTVSVTAMPLDLSSADVGRSTGSHGFSDGRNLTVGQATGAVSVATPAATNAFVSVSLQKTDGQIQQLEKISGLSHTYGADASAMMPWISGVATDAATGTITWTQTRPDGGDIMAFITGYKHGITSYRWLVFGPATLSSLTLPTLPADLGGVNPVAGDVFDGVEIYRLGLDSAPDYAALREHPFRPFNNAFGDGGPNETKVEISIGGSQN